MRSVFRSPSTKNLIVPVKLCLYELGCGLVYSIILLFNKISNFTKPDVILRCSVKFGVHLAAGGAIIVVNIRNAIVSYIFVLKLA